MTDRPDDGFAWKTPHAVVVLLVLGAFLYSVQAILNPFLLFLLLVFLLQPFQGTRHHLLLVSAAGLLTAVWVLDTTGFLLAPFVLAVVLAYVLHPLVARLERARIGRWRVSRSAAVGVLSLPLVLGLLLLGLLGIPALGAQITELIQSTPAFLAKAVERATAWEAELAARDLPWLDEQAVVARLQAVQPEAVMAWLQERQSEIARRVWAGILGVGRGFGALLSLLGYVVLTPILTFYLLRDWERIEARLGALLPAPQRERVLGLARAYDHLLARYLRGQLLAAGIVGTLTALGFWLLGFPYALLLGVVAGVFNVIPYMGLVASLIPALLIALFTDDVPLALGKIAIVFAAVQLLDQAVIGPKVVGEAVGLHPVWVLLALAVFGFFFGFVGLLIAVPLAVLVKLLLTLGLERYQRSTFFRGEQRVTAAG